MLRLTFSASLIFLAAFALLVASSPPPPPPSQPIQFSHKQHLDYFQDDSQDGHRLSMIGMHRERLLKALDDEDIVAPMIEMVAGGNCTLCHGDFDEDVENLAKLAHCAECHRYFLEHDWEGREDERPCMGCHHAAVGSPRLARPSKNTCAACHLPPLGDDPEEAELVQLIEQEGEIRWTPVYDYVPSEIIFSHERHVELAQVKCQACHGPVEQAEGPLSLDVNLSMEDCMDCHDAHNSDNAQGAENAHMADNDCLACHR